MVSLSEFDELDRRIIELMSRSSQGSYRQIAKQLDVHPTTLIQRVKALEIKGVIKGYRAKIDYMNLGYGYMGVVNICSDDILKVQRELLDIPQVMSIYNVTGDSNCVVMVSCIDREDFSATIRRINSLKGISKTNASIVLDVIKDSYDYIPDILDA